LTMRSDSLPTQETPRVTEKKVLIVQDDQKEIRFLEGVLGRVGYRVETATRAQEAVEKTERLKPHLVLVDLHLPDTDGGELIRLLRKGEEHQKIYIVVLSANGDLHSKERVLRSGADEFLQKPINMKTLVNFIWSHFRSRSEMIT